MGKSKDFSHVKGIHITYFSSEIVKIIIDGDVKVLQSIISSDPNIAKMRDDDGETLLIIATKNNQPSMVKVLIDAGSDVHADNRDTLNAYDISAFLHYLDVSKVLVQHDSTGSKHQNEILGLRLKMSLS